MRIEIGLSDKQLAFRDSLHTFDVTGYGGSKGGEKARGPA